MAQTIYIADDEKNIRELMASFLINEGFKVTAFESGDALLEKFSTHPSDMVILDIMMEGTDGLSICSMIRQKHNVPIMIVSARDSELDRITGISLGSDDYLVKPFSPLELVARVKAIFRRIAMDTKSIQHDKLTFGNMTIDLKTRVLLINGHEIQVTPTEYALIVYLMQNSAKAVSREELLRNVWHFDFDADTRVIDDVLKRLRKKIKDSDVKIESVWGYGFRLSKEGTNEND